MKTATGRGEASQNSELMRGLSLQKKRTGGTAHDPRKGGGL